MSSDGGEGLGVFVFAFFSFWFGLLWVVKEGNFRLGSTPTHSARAKEEDHICSAYFA